RSVLAMQRILNSIERLDDAEAFVLLGTADNSAAIASHRKSLSSELQVEEGNVTEDGEGAVVGRLRTQWEAYQTSLDRFLLAPNEADRREIYLNTLQPAGAAIRKSTDDILAINQDAMVRKSEEAQQFAQRMNTLMVASSFGAFALGLVLSLG